MSIFVEKIGHGEPLVMIHGWGMHSGMWMQTRDLLCEHYELHLIDLPGMGHSAGISPYNLVSVVQALMGLIPKNASILAWSLGSLISMKMAMALPINKLILVGSTPCFVNRDDWQYGIPPDVFQSFFAGTIQNFQATMNKLLALIAMGGSNPRATAKLLREVFVSRPIPDQQALQATLDILLDTDLRGEIKQLTMPVLLVHGEHDKLSPLAASEWLAQNLPQATLFKIAGAAHEPFISHPHEFTQQVREFLSA